MTTEPQTAESRPAPASAAVTPAAAEAGTPDVRVLACSRRALLVRAGAGGAVLGAAGLLAACGSSGEPAATSGGGTGSAPGAGSSSAAAGSGSAAGVPASQVPEGTAVVTKVGDEEVVLAQPTAGQYVAYSAVCTHAGGIVRADQGTEVRCPLHGSVFDAGKGGEVLQGPATEPLASKTVTQQGGQLVIT